MKKISNYTKYGIALFLAVTLAATAINVQAQSCNQVEILYQSADCFERDHQDPGGLSNGKTCKEISVCVNQLYTYSSSVTGGGWTFLWNVTGPNAVVINPNNTSSTINIVWPQVGVYTLTLTATDGSGNVYTYCLKVNVKDKPNANFTFAPNNVCAGSTISFTNTTTFGGGGVAYSWNFGNPPSGANNFSTATNPTHTYNAAGTYTVTLIAYSFTMSGGGAVPNEPPTIKICCADTITKQVTILPGTINIQCISTVCAGDTATYTAVGCPNPTWLPPIGGIIQSQSGNTVTIIWGNGNPQGQILAQCPGGCIASVPVPIIPTNPIIVGNLSPCTTATTSYTLPSLPGTFYGWTLMNISTATNYTNLLSAFPDNNTVWINWALAPPGTYQLTINLVNKHLCCSSTGFILINPKQAWTAFADQTICAGSAASLSVFPAVGTFNWTVLPPNGGVVPTSGTGSTFNPVFNNTGNYTIQVIETANTYCNSGAANPQQIQVTVVTTPTPGTIVGPAVVCAGSSYGYNMSTNAPTGYYYAWSITGGAGSFQPGNLATTTGNSVTILWTTVPGTISVSLQRIGTPPCPKIVTLNVVKATVGSISGTLSVCVDGTGTYTLSGGNLPSGEVITWSLSPSSQGTIISGQGTNSIIVLWHGQPGAGPWGPVTINASTGCGNATPLNGVMIFPKFTFTITKSGLNICQPGGVTLTATGAPGGTTFSWSGGPASATYPNITVAGTYTVTGTKGGCSFTQSYTVDDPFAIIPTTCGVGFCNGNATNEILGVLVIKPAVGPFTYKWYTGTYPTGTLIPGANSSTYTAPTFGNFYVIVTYGNCTRYLNFTVKKICCPNVNNPQITSVVRNTCNSYTFTGTTPNPNGATITWSFGDGSTATGASGVPITHVYATAGVYCVTFCVGPPSPNPTSCTGNCVATTVTVPIQAAFAYTLGCNGCLNVINTSTVITSNPSYVTYLWNFGDGNTSAAQNPGPHCYATPGTYTVTLTITFNDGQVTCTSTATQTVTYTALSIVITPTPVCTGDAVMFSSSPGGFITYSWNFGDGFTAYTASTTHIYNAAGTYNVKLKVTDQLGNTCTVNSNITVLPGIGPCVIQPGFICPGGTATLSTPNVAGYTYLWQVETTPNVFVSAPGTNTNNTYTATTPGFYRVIITAANGCSCITKKVEVKAVTKPKAIIAAAPSSRLCGSGNVALTSVNHLTGYTSDWYANGNYGSLLTSGQVYLAFGVNTTTVYNLILTNEYGCKDTCSLTVYVNPIPAQPIITSSPTLCEGVPITLTVTNYAGNISWNTGSASLSITVTAAGLYTATYTDPITGCNSSSSITINRRPPVGLFPHYCDSIPCTCRDSLGNFTIYAPKPLINSFSNYNIQWYFNNNPVGTNGPNPFYNPAVTGTYHIVVTDPLTGCKDTSKTYTIVVPPCDTCCTDSHWGDIVLTNVNQPAPNTINLTCGGNYNLACNQSYSLNAFYNCAGPACTPNVTYKLQPPSGAPLTGNIPPAFNFTPTQSGTYTLTLYGWCDNKICDSCIITFTVNCGPICNCNGSRWGTKTYTTQNTPSTINCNSTYAVNCNQPVTINATYLCTPPPASCPSSVTYKLQPPSGAPLTGNIPPAFTFTPIQTGTYTLTLYGWCGTTKCDSCVAYFTTICDTLCCPYTITVDTSVLTYTTNQQYNATIAAQNFTINGLAGVPLTEVRAEVLSYTITDNYEKECMKCVNLPYTWASILSAGNIGTVLPRITMFNTSVHPFNPTGLGVYQNPREVVWNNNGTFIINNGTQVGMNFILPPPPKIDCCRLNGIICVKFTFRDENCKECEVIKCFEFKINSNN